MEDTTRVVNFIDKQPAKKYVKVFMEMSEFLEDVDRNDDKINELIKKKIIVKSEVTVKNFLREEILCCCDIIRYY